MKEARELLAMAKSLMGYGGRMIHKREFYRPDPARYQDVKQVKVPEGLDLEIWTYGTPNGGIYGVAFQGKGQKPLWNYIFKNEAQRDRQIEDTIKSREQHMKMVNERKDERTNFKHDLVVGSILYSSWGYDQTNIDFYEVVKAGEKSVTIRQIGSKVDHSETGADYVVAAPGKFTGPAKTKRVSPGNSVRITSYSSAHLWDGKPKYETAAGWGH